MSVRKHKAFCPHCGNKSPQRIVFEHTYRDVWYDQQGAPIPEIDSFESETIVCVCETCDQVLLYDGVAFAESGRWPELRYPRNSYLPDVVPGSVRMIYQEASIVKQNSPSSFALLIRKALEAICEDRKTPEGTLAARLKYLANKGEIPPVLADVTEVLRTVGNTAAHGTLEKITAPMTWAIDDFFRAVVEYVYVAPNKLEEFRARLKKMKDSLDSSD